MKIFYISDLHLCHTNIIKLCGRPYDNTDEMNNDIVNKWNSVVKDDDVVRILGDVGFPKNDEDTQNIIKLVKNLKGNKHLILGNHDSKLLKNEDFKKLFGSIKSYSKVKDGKENVVLFHYPIEEWDGYFRGDYHLYGHVHNNQNNLKQIQNRFNVSAEILEYIPKTLEELIDMNNK